MNQRIAQLKPILTVAYVRTKNTTQDQINKFLTYFEGTDVIPVCHYEIPGDRQTTVMNIFAATKTPYVAIVSPDGCVDSEALLTTVDILEQKTGSAFATVRVCQGKASGEEALSRLADQIQPIDVYMSPGRLSSVAVYRVDIVNAIIEKFYRKFFGHFEWTLRMVLANLHGFEASDAIGYIYAEGVRDTVVSVGRSFIEPSMTLNTLLSDGLVTLDERQAMLLGINLPKVSVE